MAQQTTEARVAALETKIARLKVERSMTSETDKPWRATLRGIFKYKPDFLEAMRLGRE